MPIGSLFSSYREHGMRLGKEKHVFLWLFARFVLPLFPNMEYTLNCNGRLLNLCEPQVMGILNVTPDSFYAASRQQTEEGIIQRTHQIINEGGTIIDVGACSTRPDSTPATEQEEIQRLRFALNIIRKEVPDAIVSVDTFRPDVARMVVEEYGADIINDVGAPATPHLLPLTSQEMFHMVSRLRVPYIYMSQQATMYDILIDCAQATDQLRMLGQKDMIIDPGFGFGKTLEQNYQVMNELERMEILQLPILVGVSRKSMIYRTLNCQQEEAKNGTTVLHTLALMKGASILRAHDVKEAVETIRIVAATQMQSTSNSRL